MGLFDSIKKTIISPNMADIDDIYAGMQYYGLDCNACNKGIKSDKCSPKNDMMMLLFKDTIMKLVYSNFIWYGLDNKEAHAIEDCLIRYGKVGVIKTALDTKEETPDGMFFGRFGFDSDSNVINVDFYGNPLGINIFGYNGQQIKSKNLNDFVMCFDSEAYRMSQSQVRPTIFYIEYLANTLSDAYSAWRVAVETRKAGQVYTTNNDQTANKVVEALTKISENNPYAVITGELEKQVNVMFAPADSSTISSFYQNYINVWGAVLDLLGIENNSQNKKERVLTAEVEMNRSLSRYLGAGGLKIRKKFADEMNEKFGVNIQVENYLASLMSEDYNSANEYGNSNSAEPENLNIGGNSNDKL